MNARTGSILPQENRGHADESPASMPPAGGNSSSTPGAPMDGARNEVEMPTSRPRSAWVEVDLRALGNNFRLIRADLPTAVRLLYVVKDEAYGAGALMAARTALANGAAELAVFTLDEAAMLRSAGIQAPILLLGERTPEELPACLDLGVHPCIGSLAMAQALDELARLRGIRAAVHLKLNTGMNRFGLSWREAAAWSQELASLHHLDFAGALSHFAQSDEVDKAFAFQQLANFRLAVEALRHADIRPRTLHLCNSGGYLDLPAAHFDMVRVGILPLGVYPSKSCRRLPGLEPVLAIKARIVAIQHLEPGDCVGYGMRYRAELRRRIAVLPLGYGDGFPRVRNEGWALIRGRRAPIIGGVAMDALTVDITDLPEPTLGEEAVMMGRQGDDEITVHDVAALKRSVSYDVLAGWRARLPRRYFE
jgi:alanine racemase